LELAQETKEGRSSPLGAALSLEGANFSVYSKHATAIELLLFDCVDDARPTRVIRIDPSTNRMYHYSHVFVPRVKAGQIYGYRVEGPFDPPSGMRFDPAKSSSIRMDAARWFRRTIVAKPRETGV
jgi:isoamylase